MKPITKPSPFALTIPWILASLALLPLVASAGVVERAEAKHYALIVDGLDQSGGEDLRRILEDDYGYSVFYVAGEDATLKNLQYLLAELKGLIRSQDELVVHLSLPFYRDPNPYFVPIDGDLEEPWSLLSGRELLTWIEDLPAISMLMTYPSCLGGRRGYPEDAFESLFYSRREGSVEVLFVCDLQEDPGANAKQSRGESPSGMIPWSGGLVASSLAEALGRAPDTGPGTLTTPQLLKQIEDQVDTVWFELFSFPASSTSTMLFVPMGVASEYRQRYAAASTIEELSTILLEFVAAGLDQEGHQADLIEFLVDVATDSQADAPGAELDVKLATELRRQAVEVLGRIGTFEARDALIEVSNRSTDSSLIRWQAISRLARASSPRNEDIVALRSATSDPDAKVRVTAIQGLVVAGDAQVAGLLGRAAQQDPDFEVRRTAIQALAESTDPQSQQLLLSLLEDPVDSLRSEAAAALGRQEPSTDISLALAQRLQAESSETALVSIAYALGKVWKPLPSRTEKRIVETLSRFLAGEAEEVAAASAFALGRVGGSSAETVLRRSLSSASSISVRISAAEALGSLSSSAAVVELERAATSESAGLRRASVAALGQIGTDRAAAVLFDRLSDADPYVRGEAERAIEQLPPAQRRALTEGVGSESQFVRQISYRELGSLGTEGVEALIEGLGDSSKTARAEAIRNLSGFSDSETVKRLQAALKSASVLVRQGAATVLGRLEGADPDVVREALVSGLDDPSSAVRAEAIRSLGQRRDLGSLDTLLKATTDVSADVRRAAVDGLFGFRDDSEARKRLEYLAKGDASREVREAAIGVLSEGCQELRLYKIDLYFDQASEAEKERADQIRRFLEAEKSVREVVLAPRSGDFFARVGMPRGIEVRFRGQGERKMAECLAVEVARVAGTDPKLRSVTNETKLTLSLMLAGN